MINKKDFINEVKYAYITFKSMETKELVEKLFAPTVTSKEKYSKFFKFLYKIGIKPPSAGMGLFDLKLRKWKTIMAT